ncbi:MAG: type I restriction-modification enzyme R subunit C-terminal domain-containing protein, partial [Acholeplasma sp.]|nr:type I restriction-modification enzyme R subunit C-terminal domain-containing protein [Acholeplasma sp.]
LNGDGYRECQINAIINLEKSFTENRPRALIQMATGAGKTYTAISEIYRLLKYGKAKRILFLVDTKNLGVQAENEFQAYKPNDDHRRFSELYQIQRLTSSAISSNSKVCISTIQRMYSILKGEELDESLEEESASDKKWGDNVKDVVYNDKYPIEFFDFIFIDECHRSIYNIWQQVLDYFDAFQIGLTATPDKRTLGYFQKNIVSEYTREQAIIDGVNVGNDEWIIRTGITESGGTLSGPNIEKRERLSRSKRWEQLDEPITYEANILDRVVVVPDQIRTVIKEFKRAVESYIFRERFNDKGEFELPKTLIFAKDNSHADDIVQISREVFGEGNDFCQKITYNSDKPQETLNSFRNSYYPRIAVTVDMIATGTDVKPIECLLFLRDVRSKNYFEQMTGRGTRVLSLEELQKVSPSAKTNKDRFVLFDAVSVLKSLKTENRTLERNPGVVLNDLVMQIATGTKNEDVLTTVAGRITRLIQSCTKEQIDDFKSISPGRTLNRIAADLLNCFDEDIVYQKAKSYANEPTEDDMINAQTELIKEATSPFNDPKIREFLVNAKKNTEQFISTEIDQIIYSDFSQSQEEKAKEIRDKFKTFIDENINTIDALSIIYYQDYKRRPLTFDKIKELYSVINQSPYNLTIKKLSDVYYILDSAKCPNILTMTVDIVSLVKYELGLTNTIVSFKDDVSRRYKEWIFSKNAGGHGFNQEQNDWLKSIRDHISQSGAIEVDDFEYTPFIEKGGLGKFTEVFGTRYETLIDEVNHILQT